MADDLSSAPTGGSEPVSLGGVSAPASAPTADTSPAADSASSSEPKGKPLSNRDAIRQALAAVETRQPNETEKATAVLREGAGADERLASERAENANKQETASEASERARAGWETRRANEAKAKAKAEAEAAAKAPAQPQASSQPAEAPKPSSEPSKYEPPARLAPEAKAAWKDAPETLRAEVVRMHDELTAGLNKHKESAERYAPLADYERRSMEVYKQPLADTLKNYVELDELLATDPLAGLERIVSSMTYQGEDGKTYNWTLKQMAEYISQQDAETFTSENTDLKRELASLKRELSDIKNGFTTQRQSETEQRRTSIQSQIEAFAKEAPRYAELEQHILKALKSDFIERTGDPVRDLKAAYELAERLNPAPSLSPPAPEIPAPDLAAQTRRGQASVSGAPGSGSNPVGKKPVPATNRDAVKQAFAALGIASS